ncbi:hypothetical protein [Kiloniella laminariae]|uniref:hypothetical protein n=1 Tax=Kiloniella laminariae TaxID=454162 RepID=UPI00039FDCC8|nr:hypothetical protein [Kiloniella laminariae]
MTEKNKQNHPSGEKPTALGEDISPLSSPQTSDNFSSARSWNSYFSNHGLPKLPSRGALMIIGFLAVAIASVLFRQKLSDTALLYIGIPLVIVYLVTLLPRSGSITGKSMIALTYLLLLSFPLLQEGFICVIMAAPLMYGVVGAVAIAIDYFIYSTRKDRGSDRLKSALVVSLFGVFALEGTHDLLSFERENLVTRSAVVEGNLHQVRQRLAQVPSFDKPRPVLVRLFPLPLAIEGSGLAIGDQRRMSFVYNKWVFFNAHRGEVVAQIEDATETRIRSRVISDTSYLSNYLTWKTTEVNLKPIDSGHTEVTWNLTYSRKLDPAWYFAPLQEYVVGKVADIFIENVAMPRSAPVPAKL